jgi:ABC-type glutathione transport system ATPase component
MDSSKTNGHHNSAYIEPPEDHTGQYTPNGRHKVHLIEMREGDTLQTQMSVEGAHRIAALSPRITVTFYNVSKVINVPAKMIDPSSKERFIQRTLLDKVSGQIHPGQIVALMGPSGN